MSEVEELLVRMGLEKYASRAISVLLKEELTLKALSRKAKIPYGKVYSIVKNLKMQGLVQETADRPKKVYISDSRESLQLLFDEKIAGEQLMREQLTRIVSEIEVSQNRIPGFFQIGTTNKENREIQLAAFRQARKEVLQIINIHHRPLSNRLAKTTWEEEILASIKRGVSYKAIYPVSCVLPKILVQVQQKYPKEFIVQRKNTNFMRCDIIDKDFVLLKLVHEDPLQFGGILLIRNEHLNENLRRVFQVLWAAVE
ncbi:MAG: helix-turn-helix domain-containing protein [Nanoarchaeota archaeon]